MPAITSLDPSTGAQGSLLRILGSELADCATVQFSGMGQQATIAPSYVSAEEVRVYVPSFGGVGGLVEVLVLTAEDQSNALTFDLAAYPAVAAVYRLASVAALKAALGVAGSETFADAKFEGLLDAASATIARECRLDFRPVTIEDERYDGDGTAELWLRRGPVVSVQGLRFSGVAVDVDALAVYEDRIAFDEGDGEWQPRLRSTGRIFPRGKRNVAVDYTAGYTEIPLDISAAAIEQAVFLQNTLAKAGVEAETNSQSNSSTTFAQAALAPGVQRTVNRYRPAKVAAV